MSKTGKKRIRYSICEIENQTEYFTLEMLEEGIKHLKDDEKLDKYCYLLHDKDTYTEEDEEKNPEHKSGTLRKSHLHLFLRFTSALDASKIAKYFNQTENRIEKIITGFKIGPNVCYLG